MDFFGNDYRVVLYELYLNVTGIIMSSFKLRQF